MDSEFKYTTKTYFSDIKGTDFKIKDFCQITEHIIPEDDVQLVMKMTGCKRSIAGESLVILRGDIPESIMMITDPTYREVWFKKQKIKYNKN
tara:strand:- start:259 stop:534 length:276 start_codon:yes stop_codon:yes gene_type:complete